MRRDKTSINVAERIGHLRRTMSVQEIAEALGVSTMAVYLWGAGNGMDVLREPVLSRLERQVSKGAER